MSAINPDHYKQAGKIECIDVIEWEYCCIANAIKYVWRAGLKGDTKEDLEKALYYLERADRLGQAFQGENADFIDQFTGVKASILQEISFDDLDRAIDLVHDWICEL